MKKIWPFIIIVILIGGGYYTFARIKAAKAKAAEPPYKQVNPTRSDITKSVAATGNVTSNLDVDIKCKASGEIILLPFDIGDSVVKGELMVQLDPTDEDRNVSLAQINLDQSQARSQKAKESLASSKRDLATARDQAKIDLIAAQAQADQAQTNLDNNKNLFEKGFVAQDQVNTSITALASAKANLDSAKEKFKSLNNQEADLVLMEKDVLLADADAKAAQISLDVANQRLTDTKVFAPMDGVVTARLVQVGTIISSGISSTSGGTTIMTLSDLSHIYVDAAVDQSDIGPVELGQKAEVVVDSYAEEKFEGTVVRMAKSGDNVSNVVTFQVRIEITSSNKGLLMPKMTADSTIFITQKKGVLTVPVGAVTLGHQKSTVLVLGADGKQETRDVVTGIDDGNKIEIISGLTENDTVLVKNLASSQWNQTTAQNQQRPGPPPGAFMGGGGRGR
jgi:HlyD family secretion protein